MKNIYKIFLLAFLAVSFSACEDIDKDPFEVNGIDGPFGSFVRLDITSAAVLDVTDIDNTVFGGTLSVPSSNVTSWDLKVRRVSGGVTSDYVPFLNVTSFPADFSATPASLAAVFGLTSADLIPGDRFDFEATSIGTDGNLVTFDDFAPNLAGNPAEAQGYRFVTFLSCPFVQADAIGTYSVSNGHFSQIATTFELIAAPNGNVTMIDPLGHLLPGDAADKYNVLLSVNAGSGQTAVGAQTAWDSGHAVCCATPYGIGTIDGSGFTFSCAGQIVLSLNYRVAAGTFNTGIPFVANKI